MGVALLLVLAAAFLVVPAAHAKGSAPYRVCGERACVTFEQTPETLVVLDASASGPVPPSSPYYRLDFNAAGVPSRYFVPAGALVSDDMGRRWYSLYGPVVPLIQRAIAGLEPFGRPESWSSAPSADEQNSRWMIPVAVVLAALASLAALRKRPQSGTF